MVLDLELLELLAALLRRAHHFQNVETHRLRQRPALADRHRVAFLDERERGRAVRRQVGVALLETVVLGHVVQVVASDHNRALHLRADHHAAQNAPANRDVADERALLVNVRALQGRLGRLEAQTDLAHEARRLASLADQLLRAEENGGLLLESTLVLAFHRDVWWMARNEEA